MFYSRGSAYKAETVATMNAANEYVKMQLSERTIGKIGKKQVTCC